MRKAAWLDVFPAWQPDLVVPWTGPALFDLAQHGSVLQGALVRPARFDQVSEDNPEMATAGVFVVLYWRWLQERAEVAIGQEPGRCSQCVPILRGIRIVAQGAGHPAWMPQACAFRLAAFEVCTAILLGDRPMDIVVLLGTAVRHLNMYRLWACYLKEEFGGACEDVGLTKRIWSGETGLHMVLLITRGMLRFQIGERIGRCLLTLDAGNTDTVHRLTHRGGSWFLLWQS